ncbi:unnamed protein product [Cylindrotheca closterium]|uniref:Pseudouridine synthase RsuA/RluA-like domain-containing protein n=1 Tax=Cylindrotheca closterium TaxID=2856 RepID=A0AAD2CHW2_9STRA|nr:unnamed protein product [Cylindrotheca closterium]
MEVVSALSQDCCVQGLSHDFVMKNREVTIKTVDWKDGEGVMLPLQLYHTTGPSISPFKTQTDELNKTFSEIECLSLEDVRKNPADFFLSYSSRTQMEEHDTLSARQKLQLLQKIKAEQKARQPVPLSALRILYCDADICVVDKPSGVLSVPGHRRNPSLANLVYDALQPDIDLDQMVVHRLDMATSGILVYALSLPALSKLHSDFKNRRVQKTYQALVHGHDTIKQPEGEIDVDLERDINNPPFMRVAQPKPDSIGELDAETSNGDEETAKDGANETAKRNHKLFRVAPKESLTTWSLAGFEYLDGNKPVTRLNLRPWTGRTHQLRVHCAQALGTPIVGDEIYGMEEDSGECSKLCLHAKKLCIYHPISNAPMVFETDTPF